MTKSMLKPLLNQTAAKQTTISILAVLTLTARSREKTMRQTISILSVRPHGGSQGGERYRGSEETEREDGRSTNASNNTTAMVRPKPLRHYKMSEWIDKWM